MSVDDQIRYHEQRAMRELDQGLVAACVPAARAHLQLSSLHLARARDLQGATGAEPPQMMA
jgi:hypothetical protein